MNTPIDLTVDYPALANCDVILTVAAQSTKRKFFRVAVDRRQLNEALSTIESGVGSLNRTSTLFAKLLDK